MKHESATAASAPADSDVLVVGAGPAGISAALDAVKSGARVTVVDNNAAPGGQLWRGVTNRRIRDFLAAPITRLFQTEVIARPAPGRLLCQSPVEAFELGYRKLILATGSRERFLPFPGWTLPHVRGAGGLQALVKSGLEIRGKRVVVAGSGPLLLAVAKYLLGQAAEVPLIAEQCSLGLISRALLGKPSKVIQAIGFVSLAGRYRTDCWPVRAEAGSVTLRTPEKEWTEPCDYLACGFGLVANDELARLVGESENVYSVGDSTSFGNFPLREELKSLAGPDTIICRCEDVPWSKIERYHSAREAKLQSRCGMGLCQGRVCGPALEFLRGWESNQVRPPLFPARAKSLSKKY
jgi:NADPH-dependent 2,4-dienoyl-CoA reductase/sulfur reductase-like enzyme